VALSVFVETSLSFLGTEISPDARNCGSLMEKGKVYFLIRAWIILLLGIALASLALRANLAGAWPSWGYSLDPKLRVLRVARPELVVVSSGGEREESHYGRGIIPHGPLPILLSHTGLGGLRYGGKR